MTATAVEMRCPRRNTYASFPIGQAPGPDVWQDLEALFGADSITGPTCSYCGSIQPDVLLDRLRGGWFIEPSDRPERAYLNQPYTDTELAVVKVNNTGWRAARQLLLDQGATDDQATAAADAWWNDNEAGEHRGHTVAKIYFSHLDTRQQHEFVELYNNGTMLLTYPGHFYVRPEFCRNAGDGQLAVADD